MKKKCKLCLSHFVGRTDKIFCSIKCKSNYHQQMDRVNKKATEPIDKILHRNRAIILEVMGKNATRKKVPRAVLDRKKFNYIYHTHFHINVHGKRVTYVYDFSWMVFSDQEVLLTRKRSK